MKPRKIPRKWLLIGLLALLVAGAITLPRQIGTSSELRDRVAADLAAWTGGTVTLTEPLRVRYFPPLSLRGGFVLTNATKLPAIDAITAPNAQISLDFSELLLGQVKIDAIRLSKPVFTLKDTGTAASEEPLIAKTLIDPPIGAVRLSRGTIKTAGGVPVVEDLKVSLDPKGRRGALGTLGSFRYRGETVAFAIDTGTVTETEDGAKVPVTMRLTTDHAAARFSGDVLAADSLQAAGELEAEMTDARRVLSWLGLSLPDGESLQNATASGTAQWSGETLTFERGTFSLDGNEAVGLLAFTASERPRIEGTLDFERLTLDPYLGAGEDDNPFQPNLFRDLDADLRLSAAEITADKLELGRGGLTVTAKDGFISSQIGELQLCGGQATGRVALNLTRARTEASLSGTLSDIAVETCLAPFDVAVPVAGTGTLKLDVSTGGTTGAALIRGLTGTVEVAARDGEVPVDFLALASGTNGDKEGWSHDTPTGFETLDAGCRISGGHIWCQSFSMQTPQGTVSGSGRVDVGKQTIDWKFLIANPVAPLSASQLVMETPPRVTIRGPLNEPEIRGADRPEQTQSAD